MNMNRKTSRDDILFVIALLVTTVVAGARYVQLTQQTAEMLAQQKAAAVQMARAHDASRRG